jgi:NAD-dependent dihydropyrimidine dehydrogenase PreA subunit
MRSDLPAIDQLLDEGRIAYSSRVLPIGKSVPDRRWVLPAMPVNRIIGDAGWIALTGCVGRCPFGVREIAEGALHYHLERCYGCGFCVGACPTEAIELKSQLVKSILV